MSVWWWVSVAAPLIVLATFGFKAGVDRLTDHLNTLALPADDDPADAMSPAMAARFDAFRQHVDDALHVANDCVMCEFDRARAPRKDQP